MQKITPHLWFDKDAKAAAAFYTSVFPDSKISQVSVIKGTPSGDCDIVSFEVWGQHFMAISAGPLFKINPSISFIVNFDPLIFKGAASPEKEARRRLDAVWESLLAGGTVLMPLDKYPFSERYGWIQDKFGVTWQLILTDSKAEKRPPIVPSIMFTGKNAGRAEDAIKFYLDVFKNSKMGDAHPSSPNQKPHNERTLMYADFMIENCWLAAFDSTQDQNFNFNEAVSLLIYCDTQKEIDYYWEKLSADPKAEQCGWLKDKFGLSWQVNPSTMEEMLDDRDPERVKRVTEAFLKMKKFDLAKLEEAYNGA